MSIYADLLEFKRGLLDRVERDVANLPPVAQKAAMVDLRIIDDQMQGYQRRLDLWYKRIWDLQGLWLDPTGRMIRHKGQSVSLTKREWQLLSFFLTNPNQFFSAEDVALPAWGPEASIEQFRTYVTRLRHKLLPFRGVCEVVNEKGKGYRLVVQQPTLPVS